jgi:hypothetical protein
MLWWCPAGTPHHRHHRSPPPSSELPSLPLPPCHHSTTPSTPLTITMTNVITITTVIFTTATITTVTITNVITIMPVSTAITSLRFIAHTIQNSIITTAIA